MFRFRLTYSKTGLIRFISHRDLIKVFFRAFLRAGLPVKYSEGFSPHPRVEFCPPLPVGMVGLNELLDIRLSRPVEAGETVAALRAAMPEGIEVKAGRLLEPGRPALAKSIETAEYQVFLSPEGGVTGEGVEDFLSRPEVWLEKEWNGGTKKVEIRKGVLALRLSEKSPGAAGIRLDISSQPNLRPQDVLTALTGRRPEEPGEVKFRRLRFLGRDL
jgi:radical SAM-linked protein